MMKTNISLLDLDNDILNIIGEYVIEDNIKNECLKQWIEIYTKKKIIKDLDKEIIETIVNFQYHFSNELFYKERNNKRFEFIKNRLHNEKNVKFCYIWGLEEDIKFYHTFEQIIQATNRKVIDTHFSFKGHLDFAHFIYNKINKKTL